jgi:thioredoxin reductase
MPRTDSKRLAIIGSGPIGLEAALMGVQHGFEVQVFERGKLADHLQRWGHVKLFSPFGMNTTTAGKAAIKAESSSHEFPADDACLTGRQHFSAYLEPLAKTKLLKDRIKTENQVLFIGRHRLLKDDLAGDPKRASAPFRLLVREKGKERFEEADFVLDCSGVYGQHRWLGDGGIPAAGELAAEATISYGLEDILGDRKNHFAGKTTLVIGSGFSAATSVINLAELATTAQDTWVIWLARTTSTQPIKRVPNDPLRERDRLAVKANTLATRADGNVEYHAGAVVRGVEPLGPDKGFKVTAQLGKPGQHRTWDVDRIIANVGYTPDTNLYRELQVHECYTSLGPMKLAAALSGHAGADCLQQVAHGVEALKTPEPGFFILGVKSYGRAPHFLLRIGFEQVRAVVGLLAGKGIKG